MVQLKPMRPSSKNNGYEQTLGLVSGQLDSDFFDEAQCIYVGVEILTYNVDFLFGGLYSVRIRQIIANDIWTMSLTYQINISINKQRANYCPPINLCMTVFCIFTQIVILVYLIGLLDKLIQLIQSVQVYFKETTDWSSCTLHSSTTLASFLSS